jgi:hypothetical protein
MWHHRCCNFENPDRTHVNKDFLFACRVCHCPLVAAGGDRGATIDCPNCEADQHIPMDPSFGVNPSLYISDVEILGTSTSESSIQRIMLRRVRLRRDANGEIVRCEVQSILADLPQGIEPGEDIDAIKREANSLRELLAERDRQLAEWHTCHETVERELKRASDGAAALQTKINTTSNELARTRADLNKARAEADAHRKANEALNRQLQGILKTNKGNPSPVSPKNKPTAHRKSGDKPPGELAA